MTEKALIDAYKRAQLEIIERIERKVRAGSLTECEEQLFAEVDRILKSLGVDTKKWLESAVPPAYQKAVQDTYRQLSMQPSVGAGFVGVNQAAVKVIVSNTTGSVADALGQVGRRLNDQIRDASLRAAELKLTTNQTIREMQKRLMDDLAKQGCAMGVEDSRGRIIPLDAYAQTTARTVTREATNTATISTAHELGSNLFKMSTHYPTCAICAPRQGRVYRDAEFPSGDERNRFPHISQAFPSWPEFRTVHPNCLIAGSLVQAGSVLAHDKRWYEGEVIVIRTASGNKLTCTPNHPILTSDGWIAAGALKEGQQVVEQRVDKRILAIRGNPNDIEIPTPIEQVPGTLKKTCAVTTTRVPESTEDFHGDGSDGEVDVILVNGFLGDKVNIAVDQHRGKCLLVNPGDVPGHLNARRALAEVFTRAFRAANSIMRRLGIGRALLRGHPGVSDAGGLASVCGWHNTRFTQPGMNSHLCNAEFAGNMSLGHTSLIKGYDLINVEKESVFSGLCVDWLPKIGELKTCAFCMVGKHITRSVQIVSDIVQRHAGHIQCLHMLKVDIEFIWRRFIDAISAKLGFKMHPGISEPLSQVRFADAEGGRDLFKRLSGSVTLSDVVEIKRHPFSGHVYNLQTSEGWYVANGIITHNCRHVISAIGWSALSPETRAQYLEDAAKPFDVDPRSEGEVKAYNLGQAENRMVRGDRKQWERMRVRLGDDSPKSFAAFRKMKYADGGVRRAFYEMDEHGHEVLRLGKAGNGEKWRMLTLDYRRRGEVIVDHEKLLPNALAANADDRKFTEYLFNKENPDGWAKGVALNSRLGYNKSNWEALRDDILARAPHYPATPQDITEYGVRYEQRMVIYGRKGKPSNLIVGWMVQGDKTWMTTAYIKEVE